MSLNIISVLRSYLLANVISYSLSVEFSKKCPKAPDECPNANINFYLYTNDSPNTPFQLFMDDNDMVLDAPFLKNAAIKILIHGYMGYRDGMSNIYLKKAYFDRGSAINIIVVDFGVLAREGCYIQAVSNSQTIAKCIAKFIDTLLTIRKEFTLPDFHVISFSLGCHVAGQLKENLKSGLLERITGKYIMVSASALEAAMPLYYLPKKDGPRRLNKGDAKFIDVIHTNAGVAGAKHEVGDLDFYANNGVLQPGCGTNISCSHGRSYEYYAASIDPNNKFIGHNKKHKRQKEYFGEYVNYGAQGTYHFDTTDKYPYFIKVND